MSKFIKIFLVFGLLFMQSSCGWALITGMKNQVAEKINAGKEESNITGAEISKTKDEINSDKIETVNKTTTDNSEIGTIKASANANIKTDVKTNVSANAKVKGAVVDNSRENKQSARNIENKEGLFGIDILYMLGGISLLICGIMFVIALIIGKFFMKSKNEIILEQKYEEKNLLKAAINDLLMFGSFDEKQAAQKIINKYDNFKLMFGIKD